MKTFFFTFLLIFFFNGNSLFASKPDSTTIKNELNYAFTEAVKSLKFGNIEKGVYLLQNCVKQFKNCAACYYEFSKILFDANQYAKAQEYADKAYQLDKSNYWYLKNKYEIELGSQNYDAALRSITQILQLKEANFSDKYNYGVILAKQEKYKDAYEYFHKIELENGLSEKILVAKYKVLLGLKKYSKAEDELDKLLTIEYDTLNYYSLRADMCVLKNDLKGASVYYDSIVKYNCTSDAIKLEAVKFYFQTNDTVRLKKLLEKSLSQCGYSYHLQLLGKIVYGNFANNTTEGIIDNNLNAFMLSYNDSFKIKELYYDFLEKINKTQKAFVIINSLLSKYPNNEVYWQRFFYLANYLQKSDLIISSYNSSDFKFRSNPLIMFFTGVNYYVKEDINSAMFLFQRLENNMNLNDQIYSQVYSLLGECYYKKNNIDTAFIYFEKSIDTKVENLTNYNNYAYYLSLNKTNLERALELSKITIEKDPTNYNFLDTYAWILFMKKRYDESLKYIKLALQNGGTESIGIVEHYGDILFCLKKEKEAIEEWKKVFKNPEELDNKIKNYQCY